MTDTAPTLRVGNPAPLVTIIMIFYNAERFLSEAIQSVLTQTYRNWELLLVDDGSTDSSPAIAHSYVLYHPDRLRYLQHSDGRNHGTGPTRNLGMSAATGQYISFLDADDVYMPDRIEKHVRVLEPDPTIGVVISNDLYWNSWRAPHDAAACTELDRELALGVSPGTAFSPPELLALILAPGLAATPSICSITFRHFATVALGGVPNQFTQQYEDQSLIAKLLLSQRAVVIDECLAKYRQHESSLTSRARERGEYDERLPSKAELDYLTWLLQYVYALGSTNPRLDSALRRRLWPHAHPNLNRMAVWLKSLARTLSELAISAVAPVLPISSRNALLERLRHLRWALRKRAIRSAEAATNPYPTSDPESTGSTKDYPSQKAPR